MFKPFIRFRNYFEREFWAPKEGKPKNLFHRFLRLFFSSIKNFIDDQCFEKASTLTFYSLLSIIPLVAICFGIAQELGFGETFTELVKTQLKSQPEVAQKIIEFSNSTLENTKGGVIAGLGLCFLLWTVFRMIGNIETYFDDIWKVEKHRTLWEQAKSYIPMIILFPIFFVGANNILLFVSTKAIVATQSIEFLKMFSTVIEFFIHFFSSIISWGVLIFMYIYLPNTKVSWKAAFIAGIAAGILYSIWQWIYLTFQVNMASYGLIYGSFAALPLFLIWLNYSWLIILYGMELAFSLQGPSSFLNTKSQRNKDTKE